MSQVLDVSIHPAPARRLVQVVARRHALAQMPRVLPALAAGLLCGLVARTGRVELGNWAGALVGLAVLLCGWAAWRGWRLWRASPAAALRTLDRRYPALEDSTWLLLMPTADLPLLGQLQQQRVVARLAPLVATQRPLLPAKHRGAWLITAGLLGLCGLAAWWHPHPRGARPGTVAVRFSEAPAPNGPAPAPPRIAQTQLLVTPPAYTHLPAFGPTQASFTCPQGSRVRWQVRVAGAMRRGPSLEIGGQHVALRAVPGQPQVFATELVVNASTLYRLAYAGTVSDDYALDVRADQMPVLRIQTPQPYTLVAVGARPEVAVRATVRDDYGLTRAELVITVAQGQGEAVKFREVRRDLSAGLAGQPAQAALASALSLPKLGLAYGDELYFYLQARDNAGHIARTDAYLVQWQDTAAADGASDLGMGVKVAPAYFRSQRQIIIDTEKLLKEKNRIDASVLASRANSLGFDQQTLRLRYGKFMGEELEEGIGAAAPHAPTAEDDAAPTAEAAEHHDAPAASASATAKTDALLEPYIHRHDDAETADFLEPAVKAKLRAVLAQMWAAELRLRTAQPAAALPYEYRALRLLKQVQQQTRAFVKKAGFVPPPLPEATLRLTGELAGAAAPHRQGTVPAPAAQPVVRVALRWLAAPAAGRPADARLLEQAGTELAGAALQRPGLYLPALRALRQLIIDLRAGRPACAACRAPVEHALTELLPAPPPAVGAPPARGRLARRYFQELSQ